METHVYFDLDGTLTDPFDGIARSIRYALERIDAPPPPETTLRACIGPPLQTTFRDLVGADLAPRALELYRERFADVGWRENRVYPGIHDALDTLYAAGRSLFVATTKPRVFAEKIVEHFGIGSYFVAVFGSELDGTRVNKTELLRWALPQHSRGSATVMVGDRSHDVEGGLNNGMDTLGVSYGYGSIDELAAAGARRIVDAPAELPGSLL